MMTFSSLYFIFGFLPLFLFIYYVAPYAWRKGVLLLGSYVFYVSVEKRFAIVLLVASALNYLFGRLILLKKNKAALAVAVTADVAFLSCFKLLSVGIDSFLIPIGISFYTFKMISYQVDLFRAKEDVSYSLIDTLVYFANFAYIQSGPITRISDEAFLLVFEEKLTISQILENIENGAVYFTMGLGMKVILADHLAMLWNNIQSVGFDSISTPLAWLGVLAYSLNLYLDFWGYSLMAAGIGVCMGFGFVRNFDQPYAAAGVGDFYRRWHASLGRWFRDYVYIPLGGSHRSAFRTMINLLIVWAITGIWHGLSMNFGIWAISIFVMICAEKFVFKSYLPKRIVGKINVLLFIPLTWIVFAIRDFSQLQMYFSRLFPTGWDQAMMRIGGISDVGKYADMYAGYIVLSLVLLISPICQMIDKRKCAIYVKLCLIAVFWLSIYSIMNLAGNPFMYLRF